MKLKGWQFIVFIGLALASLGASAASPTADDIYQAARAGHLAEAQRMVDQVVAEHPNSAKAHYVAAEVYAKEGQFAIARNQLQTAERLKPGLPFVKPQAVAELKALLAAPAAAQAQAKAPARQGSFPFGPLMIGILAIGVVIAVIKMSAARTANQVYYGNNGQGNPGAGYGPNGGYPPGGVPPAGGGLGSSIVGGLATGAAVGAGIVAGEALAHHFLDGDNAQAAGNAVQPAQFAQNDDMGGADFGLNDAGSWDDGGDTFADFSGGDSDWS